MIDAPQIVHTTAQRTAIIRLTIPRDQIQNVVGPGYSELMEAIAAQGILATGPWFMHQLRLDLGVFDFEIGVPIATAISAAGRVQPGELPAVTAARTVYHGDYEGLAEAWDEFEAWIAANGHTAGPDLWEVFAIGPETNPNPAD